jgi:hypothetical protein
MAIRRIGPAANRSVVGIMNEFTILADRWRSPDLDELSTRLAATPCTQLYRTQVTPRTPSGTRPFDDAGQLDPAGGQGLTGP